MTWITVSTKVRKEIIDKAKKYGINISEFLRKALEEEVRRREEEELRRGLKELSEFLRKISHEEIVRSIREDRDSR